MVELGVQSFTSSVLKKVVGATLNAGQYRPVLLSRQQAYTLVFNCYLVCLGIPLHTGEMTCIMPLLWLPKLCVSTPVSCCLKLSCPSGTNKIVFSLAPGPGCAGMRLGCTQVLGTWDCGHSPGPTRRARYAETSCDRPLASCLWQHGAFACPERHPDRAACSHRQSEPSFLPARLSGELWGHRGEHKKFLGHWGITPQTVSVTQTNTLTLDLENSHAQHTCY